MLNFKYYISESVNDHAHEVLNTTKKAHEMSNDEYKKAHDTAAHPKLSSKHIMTAITSKNHMIASTAAKRTDLKDEHVHAGSKNEYAAGNLARNQSLTDDQHAHVMKHGGDIAKTHGALEVSRRWRNKASKRSDVKDVDKNVKNLGINKMHGRRAGYVTGKAR